MWQIKSIPSKIYGTKNIRSPHVLEHDIPLLLRYVGTESEQGRNTTNSRDIQGNIIFTFPSYIEETFQTMRVR